MELSDIRAFGRMLSAVKMPNECWEWIGGKSEFGHGRMKVNGRLLSPHRLAFYFFNGDIPEGMLVCHRCDNPSCVNPQHLFLGSHSDNMKDCAAKGRLNVQRDRSSVQGTNHPNAKLDDDKVREIRAAVESGEPKKAVARRFHIHYSIVQKIVKRQRWAHVQD